jgi:hypothetical protein
MFQFTDHTVYHTSPATLYRNLDAMLTKEHSKRWLEWEPEVLLSTVPEVKYYVPRNKLLAIQAVGANADLVCSDHIGFESVGNCFCNYHYLVGESQPIGIEECLYTTNHVKQIISDVHKLDTDKINFLGEIPGYIASVAKLYKHRVLPVPLNFGQDILDFLYPNNKQDAHFEEMKHIAAEIDKTAIPNDFGNLGKILDVIDPGSTNGAFVNWLIGCYLYNPTTIIGNTVEEN